MQMMWKAMDWRSALSMNPQFAEHVMRMSPAERQGMLDRFYGEDDAAAARTAAAAARSAG